MADLPCIYLRKQHDKRIKKGHLWVYSNEIDSERSPVTEFEPGTWVCVLDNQGKNLGTGYVNPNSLIAVRLVSRLPREAVSKSLLKKRLTSALELRQSYFDQPCYRWVFAEGDFLPGLIVDRFADYAVMQITTAGIYQWREEIAQLLMGLGNLKGVLLKNDHSTLEQEGLRSEVVVLAGDVPEDVHLVENGVQFVAPVYNGQKTGWFYDHRFNREQMCRWVKDKRVLDVFSYIGGWGIQAAVAGAQQVTCVDASKLALDYVHRNAELNGVSQKVDSIQGKAFDVMKALVETRQKFDVVILDPPAFIKRKKDFNNGFQAYRKANELAIRLLSQGGILVSGSCSMHLHEQDLMDACRGAARHLDRDCQILESYFQGVDHPVHPAIPETRYLKAMTARISKVI